MVPVLLMNIQPHQWVISYMICSVSTGLIWSPFRFSICVPHQVPRQRKSLKLFMQTTNWRKCLVKQHHKEIEHYALTIYHLIAGLVVANDNDEKRSYMLIHQLKRMQSPCFIATNHDGQHFPSGMRVARDGDELSPLRFDRVLCDVPCRYDRYRTIAHVWYICKLTPFS